MHGFTVTGKKSTEVFMSDDLQDLNPVSEVPASSPVVTMTQDEFDKKIKAIKAKEREKLEIERGEYNQVPSRTNSLDTAQVDPALIDRLVEQKLEGFKRETEQKAYDATVQAMAKKVLDSYESKMAAGKTKYSDFEQKISDFNPREYPELIQLAEKMDNTADVMYELANNEIKAEAIASAFKRNPERALKMMGTISNSIRDNQNAKANTRHHKSLSQMRPSSTAVDNGKRNIQDLRKLDFLVGRRSKDLSQ
jgi:hypothetical protein